MTIWNITTIHGPVLANWNGDWYQLAAPVNTNKITLLAGNRDSVPRPPFDIHWHRSSGTGTPPPNAKDIKFNPIESCIGESRWIGDIPRYFAHLHSRNELQSISLFTNLTYNGIALRRIGWNSLPNEGQKLVVSADIAPHLLAKLVERYGTPFISIFSQSHQQRLIRQEWSDFVADYPLAGLGINPEPGSYDAMGLVNIDDLNMDQVDWPAEWLDGIPL